MRYALAAAAFLSMGAAAQAAPALQITLKPAPTTAGGNDVARVEILLQLTDQQIAKGEPLLRLPLVVSNVDTVALVVTDVTARDSKGLLRLTARNANMPLEAARDAEAGGPAREWVVNRATHGPVTVRYSVPAQASLPPRGPAPPFAFSNDGGATSAAGQVFLLLPPGSTAWSTTIDWDLGKLTAGAVGLSSWGAGRVALPRPLTSSELRSAFFMAGRVGVWPSPVPSQGFFAAWQGQPPFDANQLMSWTGTLYSHLLQFFGGSGSPSYGVFLRYNPINAGGGVGLENSFVTTFGKDKGNGTDPEEIKLTLSHEMFHTFQPFISEPVGLESSWFGEGLATFYQRQLPLKYGLIDSQAFLNDLNFHAGRYYTSLMANEPNSEVPKRFWSDTRIRTLPYDRGMLYFATVDHAARTKSAGKRSLDDLVLAMRNTGHERNKLTNADWESLLQTELGSTAVDEFRAFLAGRTPIPSSEAFGPCFHRVSVSLRRYELGFDTAVLAEPKRIVRDLDENSAAASAGLRNGDEIVAPVPQDGIQGNQDEYIKLTVRRESRVFPISYLPRGESVDTWQWARVPEIPESSCAL